MKNYKTPERLILDAVVSVISAHGINDAITFDDVAKTVGDELKDKIDVSDATSTILQALTKLVEASIISVYEDSTDTGEMMRYYKISLPTIPEKARPQVIERINKRLTLHGKFYPVWLVCIVFERMTFAEARECFEFDWHTALNYDYTCKRVVSEEIEAYFKEAKTNENQL